MVVVAGDEGIASLHRTIVVVWGQVDELDTILKVVGRVSFCFCVFFFGHLSSPMGVCV